MKTWHWILIGTLVVLVYLVWTFRDKIPFLQKVKTNSIPDTFTRRDQFGEVVWNHKDGVYTYTLQYGIIAGQVQPTTFESFMEAYKS